MFEDQQESYQELLSGHEEFQLLHAKHQELSQRVHDAATGIMPLDDYSMERMKKEKLLLKDRMALLLAQHKN